MIDSRKTLTRLHKEFPDFDLDTLFKILDCYIEESSYNIDTCASQINNIEGD